MNSQASKAIEKGLIAQLISNVTPIPRQCSVTWCRAPKSTFSSIGTIISQISTATGRLTRATSALPISWKGAGKSRPSAMPTTMHKATQSDR